MSHGSCGYPNSIVHRISELLSVSDGNPDTIFVFVSERKYPYSYPYPAKKYENKYGMSIIRPYPLRFHPQNTLSRIFARTIFVFIFFAGYGNEYGQLEYGNKYGLSRIRIRIEYDRTRIRKQIFLGTRKPTQLLMETNINKYNQLILYKIRYNL